MSIMLRFALREFHGQDIVDVVDLVGLRQAESLDGAVRFSADIRQFLEKAAQVLLGRGSHRFTLPASACFKAAAVGDNAPCAAPQHSRVSTFACR